MDASLIAEMKDLAEQNRRLKKIYAEISLRNNLLKEALAPSQDWDLPDAFATALFHKWADGIHCTNPA